MNYQSIRLKHLLRQATLIEGLVRSSYPLLKGILISTTNDSINFVQQTPITIWERNAKEEAIQKLKTWKKFKEKFTYSNEFF